MTNRERDRRWCPRAVGPPPVLRAATIVPHCILHSAEPGLDIFACLIDLITLTAIHILLRKKRRGLAIQDKLKLASGSLQQNDLQNKTKPDIPLWGQNWRKHSILGLEAGRVRGGNRMSVPLPKTILLWVLRPNFIFHVANFLWVKRFCVVCLAHARN